MEIYVDADACPVKEEVYRVARRYQLKVTLVANAYLRIPQEDGFRLEVVPAGPDEADDWIADKACAGDIVVTADIPLAARCIKQGSSAISPKGKIFTENDIGMAVATRNLLSDLRDLGEITGGPAPLQQRDRSFFLQQLDKIIQKAAQQARRGRGPGN